MPGTMKTIFKVLLGLLSALLICALIIIIIFKTSDPNRFKPMIVDRFKATTGADLEIRGAIDVTIFPKPGVTLEDVYFDIPLEKGLEVSVKSKNLYVQAKLLSYLSKDFVIEYFHAQKINLEIHQKGKPSHKLKADDFSGRLVSGCCGIELSKLKIMAQKGSIKGDLKVQTDLEKPLIEGKLHLNHFDPNTLLQTQKTSMPPSGKVIPQVDIPFAFLDSLILDLDVSFNDLILEKTTLEKGRLSVKSLEGKSDIKLFDTQWLGGTLVGDIELIKTGKLRGKVKANIDAKQMSLEHILDKTNVKGGRFDVHFDGHSAGKGLRDVLGRWDGHARWVMDTASVTNAAAQDGISTATQGLFKFLSPTTKNPNTTVHCAAMHYKIIDGTAFALNKIAAETDKVDLLGSGQINLKTEEIDFEFNLRKKKGIELSLTKVDKYLRLEGTLAEPKLAVNPKGLLAESLSLLGALSTGGISLFAEQVFDKLGDKGSPCAYVAHEEN